MSIEHIAMLVVALKTNTTDFFDFKSPKDTVIICAVIVLQEWGKDPTVADIAKAAGYERRDTLNRLNKMVQSGHLKKVEGSGRSPDRYHLDKDNLDDRLSSKKGQEFMTTMKKAIAEASANLIISR